MLLTSPSETVSNDDPVEGEVLLAGEVQRGAQWLLTPLEYLTRIVLPA